MHLKLAWRNLWRNKRRTIITASSVFFAVVLAIFMKGIKEGTYKRMIDNMVSSYTGFVQVHKNGYWKEQLLDNSFEWSDSLESRILNMEAVVGYTPRIECFALTASDEQTKGAYIIGIDPESENSLTDLEGKIIEGEYLVNGTPSLIIGKGLSEYHKLGVGDTLVIIGQGYHGTTAAGKYPISGIVKFGSPELTNSLVYMPIKEAEWLLNSENRLTSAILILNDNNLANQTTALLGTDLGDAFEVMSWEEMLPDISQAIEWDRWEGYIMMGILYMVIGFGIFGTLMMMFSERLHEYGILISIGMKRRKIARIMFMEMVIIGMIGTFVGMAVIFPLMYWYYIHPIYLGDSMGEIYEQYGFEAVLQTSVEPYIFLNQAGAVLLLTLIASVYPTLKLLKLNPLDAIRS